MIPGNANSLLLASAADAAAVGPTKSLRFNGNGNDDPYLERSVSSASNRRTFTFAAWVKNDFKPGNDGRIFSAGTDPNNIFDITLSSVNEGSHLRIYNKTTTVHTNWNTANKLRDTSAWFHVVCAIDTTQATQANRVKVYINGTLITENGTTNTLPSQNAQMAVNDAVNHYIGRSGYYGGDRLAGYLADIYFIDGSQLDPTSFGAFDDNGVWQAAEYSGTFGTNGFHLLDFANESTVGHDSSGNNNDFTANNFTGSLTNYSDDISIDSGNFYLDGKSGRYGFDGNSSTYIDCRLGTGANTTTNIIWTPTGGIASVTKIEVNSQYATHYRINEGTWTSFTSDGSTVQIYSGSAFTLTKLEIRRNNNGGSDFGHRVTFYEINDVEYKEDDPSTLDVLFDVPTNGTQSDTGAGGEVSGNYAVLNALQTGSSLTLSNGNLALDGHSSWRSSYSTIFLPSGKWYFEVTIRNIAGVSYGILVGLAGLGTNIIESEISSGDSYAVQNGPGNMKINYNGGSTDLGSQSAYAVGDVLQLAYDADNGKLWFGKNGTYINSGNPVAGSNPIQSGISGTYCFAVALLTTSDKIDCNFGQRSWAYSAPTNFKAVCTTNLPTPTIADGSDYFDTKLYTGNSSTQTISGYEFSPDLVWLKSRSHAYDHYLTDTVRGATKSLRSNTTAAEDTLTQGLTAFTSNGFTVGTEGQFNNTGRTMVAWAWDAGSSTVSNTDGTITSSVRANPTAGFSIVTYSVPSSGTTFSVGHGLGAAPSLIIAKDRDGANPWGIYHSALGAGKGLLFSTAGEQVNSNWWNNTNPTSTLFYLNTGIFAHSEPGKDYVAYCISPVAGYSSVGSYTGNGSNDGPFIYTGHKVSWLMIKRTDSTSNWVIVDAARSSFNEVNDLLYAEQSLAETVDDGNNGIDFLSNGFKLRKGVGGTNVNGATLVYIAFASNPFQANGGLAS